MTESEIEQRKARKRLGFGERGAVEVRPERARAYVHPITGEEGLAHPPFTENGEPWPTPEE